MALQFRHNIRNYNNALAFSSLGVKRDMSVYGPQGVYTFRIQGQLCHLIGSLLPSPGTPPAFSQIYIYYSDPMEQAQYRLSHHHGLLDVNIVLSLQAMLHQYNPYITIFLTAQERLNQNANISLRLKLVDLPHYDSRQYNRPTANEIAVIMVGSGEEQTVGRDIILQARSNRLQRIKETHSSYNPLRYPLLFPFGEQGWHINMSIHVPYISNLTKTITDNHPIEDVHLTKSLSVSITHFSYTIDITHIIFYIVAVCFSKNISWMPMLKLSKVVWTFFASIKTNYDQKYIKGLWMLLYME